MDNILNEFSTEANGQRYMNPDAHLSDSEAFLNNLRSAQAQHNAQVYSQTTNLGTYPASQSNLGGLGGAESTFAAKYETAPAVSLAANLRATAQAKALETAMKNELNYYSDVYSKKLAERRNRGTTVTAQPSTPVTDPDNTKGEVEKNVKTPHEYYGVPDTIVSENDTHYIYTDTKTGEQTKVSKDYLKKIYNEDGSISDDGAVILHVRSMLPGLGGK